MPIVKLYPQPGHSYNPLNAPGASHANAAVSQNPVDSLAASGQPTLFQNVGMNGPGVHFSNGNDGLGGGGGAGVGNPISGLRDYGNPEFGNGGTASLPSYQNQETGRSTNPFINAENSFGTRLAPGFTGGANQDRTVAFSVTERVELTRDLPTPIDNRGGHALHDTASQTTALPDISATAAQTETGWSTSAKVAAAVGGIAAAGAGALLLGAAASGDTTDKDVGHNPSASDSHTLL